MVVPTKSLDTLVEDLYSLFEPDNDHQVSEENLDAMANGMKEILRARLAKQEPRTSPLRFSSLGKPNRQMWYEAHPDGNEEALTPKTYFKFLYGDLIEAMILFLVKEAGHTVEMEQHEVEVDGVKGHIDAIVDGVVVDVKSASPFGYKKFENNTLTEEDPFGYVDQLAGYANVLTPDKDAAWIAMDKVSGDICVPVLSKDEIKHRQPEVRIEELKEVIALPEPPPRCHQPVPDGKSGNMKLPTACSYCRHKHRCHTGLRTFLYSNGPRFLSTTVETPRVPEVTNV